MVSSPRNMREYRQEGHSARTRGFQVSQVGQRFKRAIEDHPEDSSLFYHLKSSALYEKIRVMDCTSHTGEVYGNRFL